MGSIAESLPQQLRGLVSPKAGRNCLFTNGKIGNVTTAKYSPLNVGELAGAPQLARGRRADPECVGNLLLRDVQLLIFQPAFGNSLYASTHVHFLANVLHVSSNGFGSDVELAADFLVNKSHR